MLEAIAGYYFGREDEGSEGKTTHPLPSLIQKDEELLDCP